MAVIPDASAFVPDLAGEDGVNMPIVSVNIVDIAANATNTTGISFVTTLANINNIPPKEQFIECLNMTELTTVNFACEIFSSEAAYRFDLTFSDMTTFMSVAIRF